MSKTFHEEAGKGDFRRPSEVSKAQYDSNWDRIFGKTKVLTKDEKPELKRCKACQGEGGCFHNGSWEECKACGEVE